MIILFYRKTCSSSKKAIRWFYEQGLLPDVRLVEYISTSDIKQVLQFTEHGTEEIVRRQGRLTEETRGKIATLLDLSFKEGLDFLVQHPEILRTPIILDDNKYLVGFNNDDIRKFIPSTTRKVQLQMSKDIEAGK